MVPLYRDSSYAAHEYLSIIIGHIVFMPVHFGQGRSIFYLELLLPFNLGHLFFQLMQQVFQRLIVHL